MCMMPVNALYTKSRRPRKALFVFISIKKETEYQTTNLLIFTKKSSMERSEFKRELERHKNQIDASIRFLQEGFENLNKRNYEFYEFIESNYFDLEERLTKLERKFQDLS